MPLLQSVLLLISCVPFLHTRRDETSQLFFHRLRYQPFPASAVHVDSFQKSAVPETVLASTVAAVVIGQENPNTLLYLPSAVFVASSDITISASRRTDMRVELQVTVVLALHRISVVVA